MEEVQVLSASKQRHSLGATKKREKAVKKPTRTAVVAPGDIEWPDVKEAVEQEILEQVKRSMKCLQIPVRSCPLKVIKGVKKGERADFRRKWVAEHCLNQGYDVANYTMKRSEVSIGVNCCSMNMERDELRGLILEKDVDPQIITKLLVPIARAKSVPVISVRGLKGAVDTSCGIKCIALGLRKSCEGPGSPFHSLLNLVKDQAPSQDDALVQRTATLKAMEILAMFPHPRQSQTLESSSDDAHNQALMKDKEPQAGASHRQAQSLGTMFSIQDEIDRLEEKTKRRREARGKDVGVDYVPPKVRRIQPPHPQ